MLVSTENGTLTEGVNSTTRQTAPGNANAVIAAAGSTLTARFGAITGVSLPNDTAIEKIMVGSQAWLMGSRAVAMPVSGQFFQLVLLVPREDYYGQLEGAALKSLVISCSTAVIGVCLAILIGFLSTRPLLKLLRNMNQLAKFDFSVLEAGKLESTGPLTEINGVESTFLVMVKAFAASIKKNSESRRQYHHHSQSASSPMRGPASTLAPNIEEDCMPMLSLVRKASAVEGHLAP
ncbi:hypothetical protein HK101_007028 [Irineochytrium annulatum]|nr:hypothetical protein HK101_007028 [Irineochytrium annulatum]